MQSFHVDPADATPIYAQLDRAIRTAIATEKLVVGTRLPTVRQMAVDLKVNANTVARVYAQLERDGVLETQRGVGTFVKKRASQEASRAHRERELRQLARRFINDGAALGYTINELVKQLHKEENQ
jgi:GntR family transcriptional regulator